MAMCSVPRDDPAAPEGECDGKTDRGLDLSHLAPGAWGLRGAVASAGWAFGEAGGSQVTGDLCLKREERVLQGRARLQREGKAPEASKGSHDRYGFRQWRDHDARSRVVAQTRKELPMGQWVRSPPLQAGHGPIVCHVLVCLPRRSFNNIETLLV
jgi:hypothetical protein